MIGVAPSGVNFELVYCQGGYKFDKGIMAVLGDRPKFVKGVISAL
jgi:hypothetical protein